MSTFEYSNITFKQIVVDSPQELAIRVGVRPPTKETPWMLGLIQLQGDRGGPLTAQHLKQISQTHVALVQGAPDLVKDGPIVLPIVADFGKYTFSLTPFLDRTVRIEINQGRRVERDLEVRWPGYSIVSQSILDATILKSIHALTMAAAQISTRAADSPKSQAFRSPEEAILFADSLGHQAYTKALAAANS